MTTGNTELEQSSAADPQGRNEALVKRIRSMLDDSPGCMCGFRESCEICNSYSEYNKLRSALITEIDGPKPAPDYGATVKISAEDIGA